MWVVVQFEAYPGLGLGLGLGLPCPGLQGDQVQDQDQVQQIESVPLPAIRSCLSLECAGLPALSKRRQAAALQRSGRLYHYQDVPQVDLGKLAAL